MFYRFLALLVGSLLLTAGCAPDPTATSTTAVRTLPAPTAAATRPPATAQPATSLPRTPLPVATGAGSRPNGKFVFAPGDGTLWIQDAASGHAQLLVKGSATSFADSPAFAPDGKQIVYTVNGFDAQGLGQTRIDLIDADGRNARVFLLPPDIKTALNWPVISPDGKWVYYTASYPVPPNKQHTEIQRMPIAGGAAQTLAPDAEKGVLSPDGKQLAFVRFNFTTFGASLWIGDADGKNPRQIMSEDVFATIGAPSFSPDGAWLLFAASGPPLHPLPSALNLPPPECAPRLLCLLAAPAQADGLPWDLWLISTDGKQYKQLTRVGADSPAPAWSRDGKTVAFFDTNGIYRVDIETHAISLISKNGGHGAFAWWEPPGAP